MAAATESKGKTPSSRLLGMKFMQRSLEKERQEEMERERKRIISEAEWIIEYETEENHKPKIDIEYQPSYLVFNELNTLGRRSFKDFNKKISALEEQRAQEEEDEEQEERDRMAAEDEEGLLHSMAKKFAKKKRSSKRRRDDDEEEVKQDNEQSRQPQKISRGFIKPE
ncbi:hypothetical protein VTP01DRAFT_10254 [Rhizomucor pusillus]|uniref:uncharacterized protein n=1 Tax=Rhizomucor pusillus TaxID=4840 RepID=UPI003743585A